jgi:RHH-type transcriptional regulator, proline utilization regulon repressor / proline dehydrogenase / delta 1-pyrroline-5-carboxylate dehydrogenase
VLRYRREDLPEVLAGLQALGYGLTQGIHSRIDETIDTIMAQARVGNVYVNRSMIGAVVGVQPFGGEGLSGTGPKAGGPLFLLRLVQARPEVALASSWQAMARQRTSHTPLPALEALKTWLASQAHGLGSAWALRLQLDWLLDNSPARYRNTLPGPTGERNDYQLHPRQGVLCLAEQHADLLYQLATVWAVDGHAICLDRPAWAPLLAQWPPALRSRLTLVSDLDSASFEAVLMHGTPEHTLAMQQWLAERPGPIVPLQALPKGWRQIGSFSLLALCKERSISTNTAAAGGNASLMTMNA